MSNTRVLKTYSHNQTKYRFSKNCEILQFLSLNLLFFKFQKLQNFLKFCNFGQCTLGLNAWSFGNRDI